MNTTTTHTPGPWFARESKSRHGSQSIHLRIHTATVEADPHGILPQIADVFRDGSLDEARANAALIAAAPEMLAALRGLDLECRYNFLNPCWDNRPRDVAGKHWGGGDACAACCARAAIAKATR